MLQKNTQEQSLSESTERFDFIVVGSGFGGSVSALRLAQKGYRVAVIEAGKRFADADFARSNWNVFRYLWWPSLKCHGIMRLTPLSNVVVMSGVGVGGGSLGYANTLLQPPAPFFQDPQWAAMADWQATLAPHYATARKMLGATQNTSLTPADQAMQALAKELDVADSFRMQDVGVYFGQAGVVAPDPYFAGEGPEREGCIECGACMVGCRHNAKNTLVKNYLYLAEKLGVKIFAETQVELLRDDGAGGYLLDTRSSTRWLGRRKKVFAAGQVVLSGGVLGTLPLLLKCQRAQSLPRLSPALGTRLRTNSEALTCVSAVDDKIDYSHGIAITSSIYVDDVTHIEPVRYPKGSDLMGTLLTVFTEGGTRWTRPLRWLGQIVRHPLRALRIFWPFSWAQRTIILLVMQTLDNSLRAKLGRRWWWPFSLALLSQPEQTHEPTPVEIPQAQRATKALSKLTGGLPQNAIFEVLFNMGATAHILGGCPIGADPQHGVVDGAGRVYGHEGLYVADGSLIPANLGVNPSLSITALAEHVMSQIPKKTNQH